MALAETEFWKHLLGQHDQRTHGRRGDSAGSALTSQEFTTLVESLTSQEFTTLVESVSQKRHAVEAALVQATDRTGLKFVIQANPGEQFAVTLPDPALIDAIADAMVTLKDAYPEDFATLRHLVFRPVEQNALAAYSWVDRNIYVNTESFFDANASGKSLTLASDLRRFKAYVETGSAPGVDHLSRAGQHDAVLATISHEFGHHLAYSYAYREENNVAFQKALDVVTDHYGTIGSIRTNLSSYANSSPIEFVAEAFSEWFTSPNPRPLAREMGELFEEFFPKRVRKHLQGQHDQDMHGRRGGGLRQHELNMNLPTMRNHLVDEHGANPAKVDAVIEESMASPFHLNDDQRAAFDIRIRFHKKPVVPHEHEADYRRAHKLTLPGERVDKHLLGQHEQSTHGNRGGGRNASVGTAESTLLDQGQFLFDDVRVKQALDVSAIAAKGYADTKAMNDAHTFAIRSSGSSDGIGFDLYAITDPAIARAITETVVKMGELYPDVLANLRSVNVAAAYRAGDLWAWAERGGSSGHTGYNQENSGRIYMAEEFFSKTHDEIAGVLQSSIASGFHPLGLGGDLSVQGIIAHEFGHHIMYAAEADRAVSRLVKEGNKPRMDWGRPHAYMARDKVKPVEVVAESWKNPETNQTYPASRTGSRFGGPDVYSYTEPNGERRMIHLVHPELKERSDRYNAFNKELTAVRRAHTGPAKVKGDPTQRRIRTGAALSNYANFNEQEFVAEALAEAYVSRTPRPLALAVAAVFEKHYGRKVRKALEFWSRVFKHVQHDQRTHGRRGSGGAEGSGLVEQHDIAYAKFLMPNGAAVGLGPEFNDAEHYSVAVQGLTNLDALEGQKYGREDALSRYIEVTGAARMGVLRWGKEHEVWIDVHRPLTTAQIDWIADTPNLREVQVQEVGSDLGSSGRSRTIGLNEMHKLRAILRGFGTPMTKQTSLRTPYVKHLQHDQKAHGRRGGGQESGGESEGAKLLNRFVTSPRAVEVAPEDVSQLGTGFLAPDGRWYDVPSALGHEDFVNAEFDVGLGQFLITTGVLRVLPLAARGSYRESDEVNVEAWSTVTPAQRRALGGVLRRSRLVLELNDPRTLRARTGSFDVGAGAEFARWWDDVTKQTSLRTPYNRRDWRRMSNKRTKGGRCANCGATSDLTLGHRRSARHGGSNASSNTVVLCRRCNGREGGKRTPHGKAVDFWKHLDTHEQLDHGRRGAATTDPVERIEAATEPTDDIHRTLFVLPDGRMRTATGSTGETRNHAPLAEDALGLDLDSPFEALEIVLGAGVVRTRFWGGGKYPGMAVEARAPITLAQRRTFLYNRPSGDVEFAPGGMAVRATESDARYERTVRLWFDESHITIWSKPFWKHLDSHDQSTHGNRGGGVATLERPVTSAKFAALYEKYPAEPYDVMPNRIDGASWMIGTDGRMAGIETFAYHQYMLDAVRDVDDEYVDEYTFFADTSTIRLSTSRNRAELNITIYGAPTAEQMQTLADVLEGDYWGSVVVQGSGPAHYGLAGAAEALEGRAISGKLRKLLRGWYPDLRKSESRLVAFFKHLMGRHEQLDHGRRGASYDPSDIKPELRGPGEQFLARELGQLNVARMADREAAKIETNAAINARMKKDMTPELRKLIDDEMLYSRQLSLSLSALPPSVYDALPLNLRSERARAWDDPEVLANVLARWAGVTPDYIVGVSEGMVGDASLKQWSYRKIADEMVGMARTELAIELGLGSWSTSTADRIFSRENIFDAVLATKTRAAIDGWADTAADHSIKALAMQKAAIELFGGGTEQFDRLVEKVWVEDINRELAANRPFLHSFLSAMHNNTQDALRAAGITHVTLYRGMQFEHEEEPLWAEGFAAPGRDNRGASYEDRISLGDFQAERRDVALNPLTSWATSVASAHSFAGQRSNGIVLAITVPIARVIGTARTGFGALHESEWVIIGGDTRARITRTWD